MSVAAFQIPPRLLDPMIPRAIRIESIQPEAADVATFTFRDPAFTFAPGQFNMLYLPSVGEAAISISSDAAERGWFAHTVRFVGRVTRALEKLRPGAVVGIRGPYGAGWPMERAAGRDLLIVAGGIGLAPLRPVIFQVLRHRGEFRNVTLLYGARGPEHLLYTATFDAWRSGGIDVHVSVDRADETWKGSVGVVPLLFYRIRIDPRETVVFTCGPEVMMHFVIYEALARRVPKDSIFVSLERNMKCAIGLCGHCQYGTMFVCREGPVISFARLEPYFNREEY